MKGKHMGNKKSEIVQIHNALRILKNEMRKTTELVQLLRELMHEDYVLLIGYRITIAPQNNNNWALGEC